jgi:hypothetical protein
MRIYNFNETFFKDAIITKMKHLITKRIKSLITEINVEFSLSIFIEYDCDDEIKKPICLAKKI